MAPSNVHPTAMPTRAPVLNSLVMTLSLLGAVLTLDTAVPPAESLGPAVGPGVSPDTDEPLNAVCELLATLDTIVAGTKSAVMFM